jgi:hypothetical protein
MKRVAIVLVALLIAAIHLAAAGGQPSPEEQRALRTRLVERFDIVPLTGEAALRPKAANSKVRLIEVSKGAILINGAPVTGGELREQLGDDAAAVLQFSYLTPDQRRALAAPVEPRGEPPIERPREATREPTRDARTSARETPEDDPFRRARRSSGERVRIFGDVTVREDEQIDQGVVAVLGSVRVDGTVRGEVVAVMGSVTLGPKAVVGRDVVSIGGRVRRAEGAEIHGGVTEIALGEPNVHLDFEPLFGGGGFNPFQELSGVPWLVGTMARFMLLVLLASIALVVARPTVEASAQRVSDRPIQTTLVGFAAQLLLLPALVLIAFVLAISIIGIPLLLLMPFVVLLLLLFAVAGFSGAAYAIGQGTRRRLGMINSPPIVDIFLGVLVILLPVLVARIISIASWPGAPLAVALLVIGFAVEFAAWSCGFGAVVTNNVSRWQARRAARNGTPAAPAAP